MAIGPCCFHFLSPGVTLWGCGQHPLKGDYPDESSSTLPPPPALCRGGLEVWGYGYVWDGFAVLAGSGQVGLLLWEKGAQRILKKKKRSKLQNSLAPTFPCATFASFSRYCGWSRFEPGLVRAELINGPS